MGEPSEYFVDKIVRTRKRNGKLEHLIKWKGFSDADNTWEPVENVPCEEGEEEEEEYTVEKIIRHRTTQSGQLEYFLKWKGFTEADNTWEPAENLNCPNIVNQYETERKKKTDTLDTTSSQVGCIYIAMHMLFTTHQSNFDSFLTLEERLVVGADSRAGVNPSFAD